MMLKVKHKIYILILLSSFTPDLLHALKVYGKNYTKMGQKNELVLFDFSQIKTLDNWEEKSDTVRRVGMSKAVIALQQTQIFQRAVFFTLLNPQENNAGFAGVRTQTRFNLKNYNMLKITARGQGDCYGYKVVLRHRNQNEEPYPTYEQFFTATNNFSLIQLPFSDFKPFYRGKQLNESEVGSLDRSNISSFGIQVYGGVYLPTPQKGVSSLEIDNVTVV